MRRQVIAFGVASALLLGPAAAGEPIGAGARDLPIFDAHVHYKQPAWEPYPPATVIELFDRNGVAMALVSSTPDEGTIRLWEFAPGRVIPELRPYHGKWGAGGWMDHDGMAAYLDDRLGRYPHRGIGEFHVHTMQGANRELLSWIAQRAVQLGIVVHVHSGAEPVRFFFDAAPEVTVIWAHAGMSEPPEVIGPLMDRHARLYADTSYRETDILDGEALDPAWRELLMRHADRFMVGSDTWVNGQWADYDGIIEMNRAWLALLPRREAEMIAFRNAGKLFGRTVGREMIGTR